MTLVEDLKEIKYRVLPPISSTIRGIIPMADVFELYRAHWPRASIYVSDTDFEITAISELRRFIAWSLVDLYPYVVRNGVEVHDCDDFAKALAGEFAKYPDWSGYWVTDMWIAAKDGSWAHAICTAIAWESFDNRVPRVYYIEPQSDHEIAPETVEATNLLLIPGRKIKFDAL